MINKKHIMNINVFIVIYIILSTFIFADLKRKNNMVIDTKANLIWQDDIDSQNHKITWIKAIAYCKNLKLGGYKNWRLPDISELLTIADKSSFTPAIYPAFKNVISSYYWSSSGYKDSTNTVWLVNFNNGGDISLSKYDPRYIRCVSPKVFKK